MPKSTTYIALAAALYLGATAVCQALTLTSPAFTNNGPIPKQYTCQGADISPPLQWTDIPAGAQSFVVIMHDIDAPAGDWAHWLLYNISLETTMVPANVDAPAAGLLVGANSWNQARYRGPCPPQGLHHYVFDLYALSQPLYVSTELTQAQLKQAMQGYVIEKTSLVGTFTR